MAFTCTSLMSTRRQVMRIEIHPIMWFFKFVSLLPLEKNSEYKIRLIERNTGMHSFIYEKI